MVRAKQTEAAAEKKTAGARKMTAPKTAAEKKGVIEEKVLIVKEEVQEVEMVEENEEQQQSEEQNESANVGVNAGEEGGEEIGGEEMEHAEGGGGSAGEKEKEKPVLTEEDKAYIAELLTTQIELSDGTEAKIFSYGPPKQGGENQARPLVCHLCRVVERSIGIKTHLQGKRHKESLSRKSHNADRFKQPFSLFYSRDGENVKHFQIYPGEDIETVTPEYEERVVDRAEWDFKKIEDENLLNLLNVDPVYEYNKSKPIIGLDYILKMKQNKGNKTRRFCVLCDEFLATDTYEHVVDIKHQATYIIKHFPKLYEKVVKGLKVRNERVKENCVRNIFRKLYRKIEIKDGFKKMIPVDAGDFNSLRSRYINKVRRMPHYNENTLDFTEAEVNVLIKKCNNGISFNEPDPPQLRPAPGVVGRKRRGGENMEAPGMKNRRVGGGDDEARQWRVYKTVKDKRIDKLRAQYKTYEGEPKTHPSYEKEWSEFWHARCKELEKDNINTETYDFEKEWAPHWEKRLRKLYLKEVTDRKKELRTKYGLPVSRRTPSPSKLRNTMNMRQMNNMPPMRGPGPLMSDFNTFGPINMNDVANIASLLTSQQNPNFGGMGGGFGGGLMQGGPRGFDGPRGGFDGPRGGFNGPRGGFDGPRGGGYDGPRGGFDGGPRRGYDGPRGGGGGGNFDNRQRPANRNLQQQSQPQQLMQQQQQQQPQMQQQQLAKKRPVPRRREPVSVISVLRLLTALEDQLGSLGPKSVQLLGKAVISEKNKQSDQLLTDTEYYMLFATAKEKLKGQIMANVIDLTKVDAVNAAIDDMGQIINVMDKEIRKQATNVGGSSGGNTGGNINAQNTQNTGGRGGNFGNDNFGGRNAGGGNNTFSGGNDGSFGRGGSGGLNNAGNLNNTNDNFQGGNFRNDGGNYRNDGGNYRNDSGNFRNDSGNFGGGSFRSNDDGRGGFNNDNNINRNNSNFDNGNYRGSNSGGNFSGPNNNNNNNTGGSMGISNYRQNDNTSNTRGGGNIFDGGNYRSNNLNDNFGGNNAGNNNPGTNFRSGNGGNFGNRSGGGGGGGGGSFGSGNNNNSSFSSNFLSNTNERSGGNFSATKSSAFGSGTGNWMGGSGSVYSNNKSNSNTPVYSSGMSNQQSSMSSFNNRNTSSNFGSGGGGSGNFRRFN